jgi:protein SCO1/2
MKRALTLLLISLTSAPAAAQYGVQPAKTASDAPPAPEVRIEQRMDTQVPLELRFRDEQGRERPLREFCGDKPVILTLAWYRCPRLCSVVLSGLLESLRRLDYEIGKEFNVVTVSIDPQEGAELAAAKQRAHAEAYGRPGAANGWHFLTGDEAAIKSLADAVGYRYYFDTAKGEYVHAAGIIVLTPRGVVSRYFYGIDYPARDLRYGLEDAAQGKIGSPLAYQLRMLCYGYDAAAGTYTFLVMPLVRAGGVLTLVVLGIVLGFFWRRERRRARADGAGKVG